MVVRSVVWYCAMMLLHSNLQCAVYAAFLNADRQAPRKHSVAAVAKDDEDDDQTNRAADATAALTLQSQAQALRKEAEAMKRAIEQAKVNRATQEAAKVEQWIDSLLIQAKVSQDTELLNSVEQVTARLRDGRFSQEQVNLMFNKLTENGNQSRSKCSPTLALLVDAAGKLDALDDNPNKRWSGRVERRLRKRLFAMDWGMDLEEEEEGRIRWF